jgi:hypothetical protein
VQKFLQRN